MAAILSRPQCVNSLVPGAPFTNVLSLISAWISNYIHYEVWDEITDPFPNFNGATVEVWEWTSDFIPHFIEHVITYPYHVSKRGPWGVCWYFKRVISEHMLPIKFMSIACETALRVMP